jgi:hypothetical protein
MNLKSISIHCPSLARAVDLPISDRLKARIASLRDELESHPDKAADEVVELTDEILRNLAAAGFVHYLKNNGQSDSHNDALLSRLLSTEGVNAAPLYKQAAAAVLDTDPSPSGDPAFLRFFGTMGKQIEFHSEAMYFAQLRNQLMHGFFVFPPHKNIEDAERAGKFLLDLHQSGLFENLGDYHFWNQNGFSGQWAVSDAGDWKKLESDTAFGQIARQVAMEKSEAFWQEQRGRFSAPDEAHLPAELVDIFRGNPLLNVGAIGCWFHPNDRARQEATFAAIGHWLYQQDWTVVAYALNEKGISFSGDFLLDRLAHVLSGPAGFEQKNSTSKERVRSFRKPTNNDKNKPAVIQPIKPAVVLVDAVHLALFSPNHLTRLAEFLREQKIWLIATGHRYEHFDRIFTKHISFQLAPTVPGRDERRTLLANYLRFRGPYHDRRNKPDEVDQLLQILDELCDRIESGQQVQARPFADELATDDPGATLEQVLEVFALLSPWLQVERSAFAEDEFDELYRIPSNWTETSPVYLALGRRDLYLEYKHKAITR